MLRAIFSRRWSTSGSRICSSTLHRANFHASSAALFNVDAIAESPMRARRAATARRSGSADPAAFVSSHFEVQNSDLMAYLRRRGLTFSENESHYVVKICPFCHPHKDASDHFKLYVLKNRGVFHCHRCSAKGSWFDLKKRLGDLKDGVPTVVDPVDAPAASVTAQPFYSLRSNFSAARLNQNQSSDVSVASESTPSSAKQLTPSASLSSFKLDSESMRTLVSNLNAWPVAKQYLLETRGLLPEVIEKYGIGATILKFPDDSGKFSDHVCLTFPWIRPVSSATAANSASPARRGRKPSRSSSTEPVKEDTQAAQSDANSTSDIAAAVPETVAASTAPVPAVEPSSSPYDAAHCDQFVTERVKARAISRKNCQRLLPSGAGWGWFGWHTVPADATTVVVTEGEFDAMAVYQATGLPAISLPNGCSSLPPQLLPMMERFKKIILWMDDDAPGQAGAESFTQKLGAGRCHIVRSRQGKADGPKDANDALRAGKNLLEIIQQATPIPHSQIATFDELRQDVYRELLEPGKMRGTPSQSLPTLNKLLKGHRRGEVTVLTGPTGTGKTTLLSQLSLDWCKQGVRTLWGSFEIKNARLAKTMLTQFAQKNLESNLEEYELWADRFAELPMYFLRFYGSSEVEQIVDAMEYAVYVHDVEHVVLDNLQFMLSGQARGIDKFDAQEHAIEVFRAFATRKNVHVTLVIHPRKELDGAQLGVNSIFGTAKATQEADNVLIVQDGGSCRVLEVKKNRFDGDVGSLYMRFDKTSKSFFELNSTEAASMEQQMKQNSGWRGGARKLEDCASQFNIKNGSDKTCSGDCATCPRSRSKRSAAKADGSYDVVIIGAGCIGASIARELSRTNAHVLLLEAADDVTQGATKGNSGIVHAGFDDTPGSVRSKFCWPGNQLFPQLDRELHFGFVQNGSLVIARSAEDVKHLNELKARGEKNGVKNLKIIDQAELRRREPHLSEDCVAALYSPDAGTVTPYEFTIALAENAVDNGVELRIRREVSGIESLPSGKFRISARHWEPAAYINATKRFKPFSPTNILAFIAIVVVVVSVVSPQHFASFGVPVHMITGVASAFAVALLSIPFVSPSSRSQVVASGRGGRLVTVEEMKVGGSGSMPVMDGQEVELEQIEASFVINAAGSASDKVAAMIGDKSFKIKPRIGDYLLLHRDQGYLSNATLFPCPGPLGKGILVQSTLWGNLILGPTARDVHNPEHAAQTPQQIQAQILSACKKLVPGFDPKKIIHGFNGSRAKSDRNDWIIESSAVHNKFINVAGIDSPGLAGSPAIALEVVRLLSAAGFSAGSNPTFNPNRAPIITPKPRVAVKGSAALKIKAEYDPKALVGVDPALNVVCKCEKVTEAEILTALHRSLPVDTTQAIRKRTRAGMGHCQGDRGNYDCECRVADIIARELHLPAEAVGRRPWPATSSLPQRWLSDEQKAELVKLSA